MALNQTEFVGAIAAGLRKAGISDAEARSLAPGLAMRDDLVALQSHDDAAGVQRVIDVAADVGRPIIQARLEKVQAEQARADAAEQQTRSEADSRVARALADPAYDRLWMEMDPVGRKAAWKSYLERKAANPAFHL